jgi:hypothetical protein
MGTFQGGNGEKVPGRAAGAVMSPNIFNDNSTDIEQPSPLHQSASSGAWLRQIAAMDVEGHGARTDR